MAIDKNVDVLVASYPSKDDALTDMAMLNGLAEQHIMNDVTIAMVYNDNGKIRVHQETNAGKALGTVGVLGGLIVGAIFPPAGLAMLGGAITGGAALGLVGAGIGHFAGGISHKGLKQVGELLSDNEAALIVVAEDEAMDKAEGAMNKALKKARHALDKDDVAAAVADIEEGAAKADIDLNG